MISVKLRIKKKAKYVIETLNCDIVSCCFLTLEPSYNMPCLFFKTTEYTTSV